MREANPNNLKELQAEIDELRHQLFEAQETIDAIRTGQIDALVVEGEDGHQLYTLKTADHTYRVFIEKMNEGAVTLNREGIIMYCNSQFANIVGKPLSSIIGHSFHDFIADERKADFETLFQSSWGTDAKEEIMLKTSSEPIPVQLSYAMLELEEGISLSIIVSNLSAQKKAQRQLIENNRQLAEINHALELSNHDLQQFASVASHDLQEPLRKIQVFSNLLKRKEAEQLSVESQKHIDKIIESAARMKALIVDVLNYSKLSASTDTFTQVDLNELVKEVLQDFELIIEEKHATVTIGSLPVIEANKGQIRQAFQNIISNALKFSKPNQPPTIQIRAKRISEISFEGTENHDGYYTLISIKDNGIGFDEKYLNSIFALFERLHTKDNYEGTGIGLAITKKIMDKHNGLISAKSLIGEGSEFLLLLPVEQKIGMTDVLTQDNVGGR